jgi:predicted house-cleaning NTP pyrophosphatase (Maf/HAM1 superfamily)
MAEYESLLCASYVDNVNGADFSTGVDRQQLLPMIYMATGNNNAKLTMLSELLPENLAVARIETTEIVDLLAPRRPILAPRHIALQKVLVACCHSPDLDHGITIVVGTDTMRAYDSGVLIGKLPEAKAYEAANQLISTVQHGRTIRIVTGIALLALQSGSVHYEDIVVKIVMKGLEADDLPVVLNQFSPHIAGGIDLTGELWSRVTTVNGKPRETLATRQQDGIIRTIRGVPPRLGTIIGQMILKDLQI